MPITKRRTRRGLAAFAGLLIAGWMLAAAGGQEPTPLGGEFPINSINDETVQAPSVAALDSGGFVVSWTTYDSSTLYSYLRSRRFSAAGAPVEADLELGAVFTFHDSAFREPEPLPAPDDGFVIAFDLLDTYYSFNTIHANEVESTGAPGSGHTVSTSGGTYYLHNRSDADRGDDDELVVVWDVFSESGGGTGILARRLAADGTPLDDQFLVNLTAPGNQQHAAVAKRPGGEFLVVWDGPEGAGDGVWGRKFAADGSGLTGDLTINALATGEQTRPVIAALDDRGFVVVWEDDGRDGSGGGLFGRRLAVDGTPLGDDFPINQTTAGEQSQPAVAAASSGFVVAWADGGTERVHLRQFDAAGVALGDEVPVTATGTAAQDRPSVAATGPAEIVVAWRNEDAGVESLAGRRFAVALFEDGFESGDTSRWSLAVP